MARAASLALLLVACGGEAAVCAACGSDGGGDGAPDASTLELGFPTEGAYYHGVYPGGPSGDEDDISAALVDAYQDAVGRTVAWVYFSHNWFKDRGFPAATCDFIRAGGAVPFVRLMLRSTTDQELAGDESVFTLAAINAGDFDADLDAWGDAAAEFGDPLLVEYGTEMNGFWFPWNASWNGEADGPAAFVAAYRRIHDRIEARAANVTWVWHVNSDDDPVEPWNQLEAYYPGADYVDWMGVSIYGAQTPLDDGFPGFREQMDAVIPRMTVLAPAKPIMVLEFGATAGNPLGDPAEWADDALRDLLDIRWPAVRGFSWWNEAWQNDDDPSHDTDMRVQTVDGLAGAILSRIAGSTSIYDRPILY